MVQMITPDNYFKLVGHYLTAYQAQEEVRREEKYILEIVDNENIIDAIYNPSFRGTKKELDEILLKGGIMVEWQEAKNKFAKEKDDKGVDVSG